MRPKTKAAKVTQAGTSAPGRRHTQGPPLHTPQPRFLNPRSQVMADAPPDKKLGPEAPPGSAPRSPQYLRAHPPGVAQGRALSLSVHVQLGGKTKKDAARKQARGTLLKVQAGNTARGEGAEACTRRGWAPTRRHPEPQPTRAQEERDQAETPHWKDTGSGLRLSPGGPGLASGVLSGLGGGSPSHSSAPMYPFR